MTERVLQVFVFRDGAYVGSEVFTEPEIVVGQGDDADLHLDDPTIGDAHLILGRDADGVRVVDLGEPAGTTLNGVSVRHGFVKPRDDVGLGHHRLKVKLVAPRAAPIASPAEPPPTSARPSGPPPVPSASARPSGPSSPSAASARPSAPPPVPSASVRPSAPPPVPSASGRPSAPPPVPSASARPSAPPPVPSVSGRRSGPPPVPGRPLPERSRRPGAADRTTPEPGRFGSVEDALDSAFGAPDPLTTARTEVQSLPPQAVDGGDAMVRLADDALAALEAIGSLDADLELESTASRELADSFHGEETEATPYHRPPVGDLLDAGGQPGPPAVRPPPIPPSRRTPSGPEPAPVSEEARQDQGPTGPAMPAHPAFAPTPEEELDPDEREADERPGFSLLDALEGAPDGGPDARALELVVARGGDAAAVSILEGRGAWRFGQGDERLRIRLDAKGREAVVTAGAAVRLGGPGVPPAPTGGGEIRFGPGQSLVATAGERRFSLRFVQPPAVAQAPRPDPRMAIRGPVSRAVGSSMVVHGLVAVLVGLTTPSVSFSNAPREVWAEVEPETPLEVEVPEPPPPEPEPEPEPAVQPEPEPEPKRATPPPSPVPQRRKRAPKGKPERAVKRAGVLGSLGKLAAAPPGRKSMVQAASNLDATSTPGGSSFRVGSLIGKAPTSDVRLGGGGGGKRLTRGSAELLGGKGFARIGKKSGTRVRGKVGRVVKRRVEAKGRMTREEIAKVINAHIGEIRGCYERALIAEPGLRGKLTLEWTIKTDGRVRGVKQKFNTLKSSSAVRCMMSKVKRWRFPRPRGGVVITSYPFDFDASAY